MKSLIPRIFKRNVSQIQQNNDLKRPLIQFLTDRGLVSNVTSDKLESVLQKESVTLYLGADPTARSLHVGNMVPLMVLLHFYIRGHNPIALVGGATGEVGDPSGRSTERAAMEQSERLTNIKRIHDQMQQFLKRGHEYATTRGYSTKGESSVANNADWWRDVNMLQFLGKYGRHIRVGDMLARESVKARLKSEAGIGFNEFTYQVLQAFDFWKLYSDRNCRVQLGGNDQWGNITAGIDLISRLRNTINKKDDAFGVTVPLLTTPSGEKFGKSAGNAVWLDPELTKPYELYQYFIKSPDSVVENYLSLFTLLPSEDIANAVATHSENEGERYAQRILAQEVTDLVHGNGAGERAEFVSKVLFDKNFTSTVTPNQVLDAFTKENMVQVVKRQDVINQPWRNVLANVLEKSKAEVTRLIKGGGVYAGLSRTAVTPNDTTVDETKHVDENLLLVRVGKSLYKIIKLE